MGERAAEACETGDPGGGIADEHEAARPLTRNQACAQRADRAARTHDRHTRVSERETDGAARANRRGHRHPGRQRVARRDGRAAAHDSESAATVGRGVSTEADAARAEARGEIDRALDLRAHASDAPPRHFLGEERQRDDDAVRAGSRPRADGRRHHEYASGKRGREGAKAPTLQRGQLREAGVDLGDVVRIREVREERVGGAWSFRASRRRNGQRLRVVGARDGDRGGIVQGTERARDRLRRVPFETPEDVADAGEGKIELVVGDHEGRRHAEDVGIAQRRQDEDGAEFRQCRGDGVGVEPLVLEEREEPARASVGSSELDRRHEPAAANLGDSPRIASGEMGETSEQARALAGGAVDEAAGRERLEHGEPHATGNVVVGKRRRVTQRERVIPEIGRRETSAEGEEPAAERLGHEEEVGRDALVLAREESSRSPEPGLDLVDDERHAVP